MPFYVNGYYVGVAHEGRNSDQEVLIKDLDTDDILAVRNVPGAFPNYGYTAGDQVRVLVTRGVDGT